MNNHVDYQKKWFHVSDIEQKLYKKLNVKKWKGNMGTYDPDCFDSKRHILKKYYMKRKIYRRQILSMAGANAPVIFYYSIHN